MDAHHSDDPSIGDYAVVTAKHLDAATHKLVGSGTAICTQIDLAGKALQPISDADRGAVRPLWQR